jgi:hypothetical protein
VNHAMKMSKISATCQPMKYLKDTCPMTRVHDFFRIYRELLSSGFGLLGFLLFRLVGTFEAQSSVPTVKDLLFKNMVTPRHWRSLGSFN